MFEGYESTDHTNPIEFSEHGRGYAHINSFIKYNMKLVALHF